MFPQAYCVCLQILETAFPNWTTRRVLSNIPKHIYKHLWWNIKALVKLLCWSSLQAIKISQLLLNVWLPPKCKVPSMMIYLSSEAFTKKKYQVGVAGGIYVDPFFTHYLHKTVAWLLQDPATGPLRLYGIVVPLSLIVPSSLFYAEPHLCWMGVVSTLAALAPFGGQTLLSIFVVWITYCR